MRKILGLLIAPLMLAAFALPSSAAGPVKIFTLVMSPSTVTGTSVTLSAKFSNATPNGNSVINTIILTPPAGVTDIVTSFPNGGSRVSCPATTVNSAGQTVPVPPNSICVSGLPSVMKAACSPVACSWTMNVTATLPNSCSINVWAGQAFAGNSFNGDVFAFQSGISSVTTTINAGCTFNINAAANPSGSGTVTCTPNPVSYGGNSSCTATAGSGFSFTAFSGDCTGSTCTLSNVTSTKNVTANFAHLPNTVQTAVNPTGSGSVSCSPNPVPYDGSTTCTATAGTGYGFVNFSGDCSGTSCTLSNVTSTKSVTANFAQNAITAVASPAAGGSVICTPNPVPYGGSSTCTATASSKYTFTAFSGDCTGATCVLTNVTSNKNVTAAFVSNTLAITSAPTSAAVNNPFDVTIGSTPTGATVSFSAGCDATATPTSNATSTTFRITISALPTSGVCTMTFSADNYEPTKLENLPVYKGVLFCGDYDDSSGGTRRSELDPDQDIAYSGNPGWALVRGPNKDGSACVPVNYSCNLDTTFDGSGNPNDVGTCTFDKASGQLATFKYVFLWTPTKVSSDGWYSYRPVVSWNIANPSSAHTLPDWVPLLGCAIDIFPTLPILPTTILPVIPSVPPFTDSGNTHAWYQPTQTALVCGAQHGWTAVGRDGGGNILMQGWDKVVDESDLSISPK